MEKDRSLRGLGKAIVIVYNHFACKIKLSFDESVSVSTKTWP